MSASSLVVCYETTTSNPFTIGLSSLVASSAPGNSAVFLRGDGTWSAPPSDPWTYVQVSTGHVATSNTAFFDITSLQFTPGTNSTYEFETVILMKTSTAATMPRFQFRWPTACSSVGWMNVAQTFSTVHQVFGNDTSTMNSPVGALGTTTAAWPMIGGGVIRTFGGTASSFGVMHASESAGVYISTMVGSFLKYRTY